MADPDPTDVLLKIRQYLGLLSDHKWLIKGEWQPIKSVVYIVLTLIGVEFPFVFIMWIFFRKQHLQAIFDLSVTFAAIDIGFVIIVATIFMILRYVFDK